MQRNYEMAKEKRAEERAAKQQLFQTQYNANQQTIDRQAQEIQNRKLHAARQFARQMGDTPQAHANAMLKYNIPQPVYAKYVQGLRDLSASKRERLKDVTGRQRYVDDGSLVFPGVQAPAQKRDIIKGADGYQYYQDTGQRVLPNVRKETPKPSSLGKLYGYTDPATQEKRQIWSGDRQRIMDLTNQGIPLYPMEGEARAAQITADAQGGLSLSKKSRQNVEKEQRSIYKKLNQLQALMQGFDPEQHTYASRAKNFAFDMADRASIPLTHSAQKSLTAWTQQRRKFEELASEVLREMSGAAVSEHEYKRIMATLPAAGDGPTQAQAKMRDFLHALTKRAEQNAAALGTGTMLPPDMDAAGGDFEAAQNQPRTTLRDHLTDPLNPYPGSNPGQETGGGMPTGPMLSPPPAPFGGLSPERMRELDAIAEAELRQQRRR